MHERIEELQPAEAAGEDVRVCPRCAETIKRAATACRLCGKRFPPLPDPTNAARAKRYWKMTLPVWVMRAALIIVAGIAKWVQPSLQDHQTGSQCLSSIDGSNRAMVEAVKERLRDPGSFQHMETRIAPADEDGLHLALMTYRAKNGFGGVNVSTATAKLSSATCSLVGMLSLD